MIKKATKSVGVAPQHCGSTNQIENCQVVVMLTYAAVSGHAFIGHRLYLPERWTSDPDRCREAGIPKDVEFTTKPEQAVELLQEADDAKVPFGWVAVDGGYGQYRVVRDWCTTRSHRYVMAVPSSQPLARVHAIAGQQQVKRMDDLLARATRWEWRSCGHGSKGERYYDWAFFTVTLPGEPPADGFEHTLLIRRSIADPTEVGYFLAHAPAATPVRDMVAVAGIRWRIEECNEQGKDLLGLDQHQVRTWTAFHHHVAVCVFAHAFAATRRAHQQRLAAARRVLAAHAGDASEVTGEGAHRGTTRSRPRPEVETRSPMASSEHGLGHRRPARRPPTAPPRPAAQGPLDPLAPDPPRPRPDQPLPPTRRTASDPPPRIGQRSTPQQDPRADPVGSMVVAERGPQYPRLRRVSGVTGRDDDGDDHPSPADYDVSHTASENRGGVGERLTGHENRERDATRRGGAAAPLCRG